MAAGLGSPDVHGECWTAELFIIFRLYFLGCDFSGEGNRTKLRSGNAHLRQPRCWDRVYEGNLTAAHSPPDSTSHFLFLVLHIAKKLC